MKRNHVMLFLGAATIAILMGSCDALFTNQFQTLGLGQVSHQMITEAVAGGTDAIIAQSGLEEGGVSPSFLAAATATPETADQVKGVLQATIDDPAATPEEKQAAEVLIIEIELEMNGGNDLIDNIVGAIGNIDFHNFSASNPADLAHLFSSLFPARGPKALPEGWTIDQVAAVLDGIAASQDRFAELAQYLVDGGYSVPGIDAGRIAQVGTIANILSRVGYLPPYTSIGNALANLINDITNSLDPEHFLWQSYITIPNDLIDDIRADQQLESLFIAAGLNLDTMLDAFTK
ncbi:MAG TPA: hypothetical protein VN445_11480 [Rectinemataceae bacterium]|nr:hypothetical protein [Rectinemataceae bacterium]